MKWFWKVIDWLMTFDNEPTDFDYDEFDIEPISQVDDN